MKTGRILENLFSGYELFLSQRMERAMPTATKRTPAKKTAPAVVFQSEPVADPFAVLEAPIVAEKTGAVVDIDKIPASLKQRVEDAWAAAQKGDEKWRIQATATQEQADAVESGMRKYAEHRPGGRVTLRAKPLETGVGVKYKVAEFVARPRT